MRSRRTGVDVNGVQATLATTTAEFPNGNEKVVFYDPDGGSQDEYICADPASVIDVGDL